MLKIWLLYLLCGKNMVGVSTETMVEISVESNFKVVETGFIC